MFRSRDKQPSCRSAGVLVFTCALLLLAPSTWLRPAHADDASPLAVEGIHLGMTPAEVAKVLESKGYKLTDSSGYDATFLRGTTMTTTGAIQVTVDYTDSDGQADVQDVLAFFWWDASHLTEREALLKELIRAYGNADRCKSGNGTLTGSDLLSATCWWSRTENGQAELLSMATMVAVSVRLTYVSNP